VKDGHVKDVAQDVAEGVLGAAEDGGMKVFVMARAIFRLLPMSLAHNGSVHTYLCCQAMAEREAELCGLAELATNEDISAVALTRAQLRGLPDDFAVDPPVAGAITGPEEAGGGGGGQGSSAQVEQGDAERLSVGLKAPLLGPVLQAARDGAARRLTLAVGQRHCCCCCCCCC